MTKSRGILGPRTYWQPEELALLASMYPDCHGADCAAWLGKTLSATYQAAKKIGAQKSAEYLASDASGRVRRGKQHPSMIASQFKPGLTPWNKGRDSRETGTGHHPNTRRTQFAKGRKPEEARNYKPIGSVRIMDGMLFRKITDDPSIVPAQRWRSVARIVWEEANGPTPSGYCVRFKPGMATTVEAEITLDRLECVTRVENMKRNSYHTNYPPEVRKLVQLKGAISRQVNRITKEANEQPAHH